MVNSITPNLDCLLLELPGEEGALVGKLLKDEDMLFKICSSAQVQTSKSGSSLQQELQLASQIFEYMACIYLREFCECIPPQETYDIFHKIFATRGSKPTIPDGLSWNGDGLLWFNEYEINHNMFGSQAKTTKYMSLFVKLYGEAMRTLKSSIGYNGNIEGFALRLVLSKDDRATFDVSQRLKRPFEIRNCPVSKDTMRKAAKAAISDYPRYFNLGIYR